MILLSGLIMVYLNFSNQGSRKNVVEWCKNLYQHKNRRLRNIYRQIFLIARSYSIFIFKFLLYLFTFVFIFTHFGLLILYNLILKEKYSLPGNFFLPFLPPKNLFLFFLNEIHQFFAFGLLCVHLFTSVSLFFIVMSHFIVDLDAIERLITNMTTFVKSRQYSNWVKMLAVEIEALKV